MGRVANMSIRSIAGEWRGHYYSHRIPDVGSGFSAFISENSGRIEGTIVDDNAPGKASFRGSFAFPTVLFTKVYVNAGKGERISISETTSVKLSYANPIEYEGSMSEDGKTIQGTWTITNSLSKGTWTAYRIEEEEKKEEISEKKKIERGLKVPQLDEHFL
jgi:hypothetical protein